MAMEQRTRRRPLTRQEQLVLQERKQLRREKMEQSRELAKGPIDLPFCLLVLLLTAIGLGTTFYNPNWRVVCYTFLGTVFTVVAQGALNVLLNVYGIPTLTFPFVVAAWIFLLPNIDLLPKNYQS